MKVEDLLKICVMNINHLEEGRQKFVLEMKRKVAKKGSLTDPQYNYLQGCYDECLQKEYGLEAVAKPNDWWKRRKRE